MVRLRAVVALAVNLGVSATTSSERIAMHQSRLLDRARSVSSRWRTTAAVASSFLVAELGARIGLPGVDGGRVRDALRAMPRGLLWLYDILVGGGVSRAAIFALGALPYLQAKLYLWLARAASSKVHRATAKLETRRSVVRVVTVGLAAVQSLGFARFLQQIPGAVAEPGIGFLARTVLLITGGAVVAGWLAETLADSYEPWDGDTAPIESVSSVAGDETHPGEKLLVGVEVQTTTPLLPSRTPEFLNPVVIVDRARERTAVRPDLSFHSLGAELGRLSGD